MSESTWRYFHVTYSIGGRFGQIDMRVLRGTPVSPALRDQWRSVIESRHPDTGLAIITSWIEFESGEGF